MANPLKTIINKLRRKKDTEEDFDPRIFPAKDVLALTTDADTEVVACKVNTDHTLSYKIGREKRTIKIKGKPSTLTLPLKQLWTHKIFKYWAPRRQRFRMYTAQKEGEFTHSPNTTGVTEELMKRFETGLKLESTTAKAHLAEVAIDDMKDQRKKWWDYLETAFYVVGYIAIVFIMNGG